MNSTPRLRSAFPSTPQSNRKNDAQNASTTGPWASMPSLPSLAPSSSSGDAPLIPSSVLDAPSQRLYIAIFYLALTAWRFYDYFALISDDTESLWLFMKWAAIDSAVIYGLPGLRIPWLQWSSSTMTLLFVGHGVMNAILMFRTPVISAMALKGLNNTLTSNRFHCKPGLSRLSGFSMTANSPYQKEALSRRQSCTMRL